MTPSRLALLALVALGSACAPMEQGFVKEQDVPAPDPEDSAPPVDPPGDLPVAVCTVSPNPVTPPFETARWDGRESYDPEGGEIVSWEWTLSSKPSGSAAQMPSGANPVREGFEPDLAGDYVGRLVVTNDSGEVSEPCEVTLQAIPAEDLWVEMYWTHEQDDMDLHLVRPGGQAETNNDCYFANCVGGGLDWGVRGDPDDDPSLDLDDIPGVGPENINIMMPEAGDFTVYVRDYTGSTPDYNGANSVTVNVYLNGSQVWTNTKSIAGENSLTPFCRINWQTGDVTTM